MKQARSESVVEIGYVAKAHGVYGELRVVPYHRGSTVLVNADHVYLDGIVYSVNRVRPVSGDFLVVLDDVADRNTASALRGKTVSIPRSLIPLKHGEVLLIDLVGCTAYLPDGSEYGTVADIEPGSQDRLVIHRGNIELLLPYVEAFVKDVDIDAKKIIVDPPEGLPESVRPT